MGSNYFIEPLKIFKNLFQKAPVDSETSNELLKHNNEDDLGTVKFKGIKLEVNFYYINEYSLCLLNQG